MHETGSTTCDCTRKGIGL